MNKAQIVEQLSNQVGLSRTDCERVMDCAIEKIKLAVKEGEGVTLVGFGTFARSARKARTGRNPQTGEKIEISATTVPKFRPGKAFKELLN